MDEIRHTDYTQVRKKCGPCFHRARSAGQADLYELEWEGHPSLLKDFSKRPWIFRVILGRRICSREVRILNKLCELEEVPRLYAVAGSYAYVMQKLDGVRMPPRKYGQPSAVFWARAKRAIQRMHDMGIAHGDLRLKNILIGPQDQAYLIDFATAVRLKWDVGFRFSNLLFHQCQKVDWIKYARMKAYYDPGLLDDDERNWLGSAPFYLTIGRVMKKRVYRMTKMRKWGDKIRRIRRWFGRRFGTG